MKLFRNRKIVIRVPNRNIIFKELILNLILLHLKGIKIDPFE